jgi:hypothetical protein
MSSMNIQQVISENLDISRTTSTILNSNRVLYVYIGKVLNRQCFLVNNKLFMDTLYTYLLQNGWYMRSSHVQKEFRWTPQRSLVRILDKKKTTYLGMEVPVGILQYGLERNNERIVRYTGTYFDVMCISYEPTIIHPEEHPEFAEEFQANVGNIFSQCEEEIHMFSHVNNKLTVLLTIERGEKDDENSFITRIEIQQQAAENAPEVEKLFEVIELAMCKYKKTDRGINSEFTKV